MPHRRNSDAEIRSPESLTTNDIIILVTGLTGAGKSTFIKFASERDDVEIGHGLTPCTRGIHLIEAKQSINDRRVIFVDTPGFNDAPSQDTKTMKNITTFLQKISKQNLEITAILYLHRISDNRMTYTSLGSIRMFIPFCGKKAGSRFTLATTMWADVDVTEKIVSEREEELKTFVPPMPEQVSTCRFDGTFESAWKITNEIVSYSETVIAVIGLTGSGKSTFIAEACKADEKHINHSMQRRDPNIRAVRATHPNDNRSIVFVDTPGFDNVDASDTLTLIQIAEWLNKASDANGPFSAIVFLHRITDSRISGPSRQDLDIFASLCGQKTMPDVVLVTTMWENIDEQTGRERENNLKREFWGETRVDGGKTERFENTYDSAWKIVGTLSTSDILLELQGARNDDISTAKVLGLPIPKWLRDLAYALRGVPLASRPTRY